jgi:hypothetical protein
MGDLHALRHLVGEAAVHKNPEKLSRIKDILTKARLAIETVVNEG